MFFFNSKKLREIDQKIDILQITIEKQNEALKNSADLIQSMINQYSMNENDRILELRASLFEMLDQQQISRQNKFDELRVNILEQLAVMGERNTEQINALSSTLEQHKKEVQIANKKYSEDCILAIKGSIETVIQQEKEQTEVVLESVNKVRNISEELQSVDVGALLEQYAKNENNSITTVKKELTKILFQQELSQQDRLNELEKGIQLLLMNSIMDLIPTEK